MGNNRRDAWPVLRDNYGDVLHILAHGFWLKVLAQFWRTECALMRFWPTFEDDLAQGVFSNDEVITPYGDSAPSLACAKTERCFYYKATPNHSRGGWGSVLAGYPGSCWSARP